MCVCKSLYFILYITLFSFSYWQPFCPWLCAPNVWNCKSEDKCVFIPIFLFACWFFALKVFYYVFSSKKKKKAFFWKRDFDFVHQWNTPVIFLAVIPAPLLTCLPVAPSGGRVAPVADQTVEFEVGIKIIKVLCLTNMQPDHEETLKPLTSHLYTFHCLEAFGNWDP